MFTSNLTQYITENNVNISPLTCVDTLYYERALFDKFDDGCSTYIVKRQNMVKHMPIGYTVKNADTLDIAISKFKLSDEDYEIPGIGNELSIIGDIHKIDVSLELYRGLKARSNSAYNLFNIINKYNDCSFNYCILNYSTKYQVNSSIKIIEDDINNIMAKTYKNVNQNIVNIIYPKVQSMDSSIDKINRQIINLSTNVDKLNASITQYGNTVTEQDTQSVNSMIYTHEALWQLIANNELVPGNVYNMLYYPKHDVSLNFINHVSFLINNDEANAQIINDISSAVVNTATKTYEPFPYILKLRATSKCTFSKHADICDYESVMNNYMKNVFSISSALMHGLISQPYNEVFEYKNISPVILDFIYNKESLTHECIIILYDHTYGYIFMQFSNITKLFRLLPDNIYAIDPLYRYSLRAACKNTYDRVIFKKTSKLQSLKNIEYTDKEYKNIVQNFLQSRICIPIDNEFINTVTLLYIPLINAIKSNWNISNQLQYTSLNTYMKCDKWKIKYSYYNNEIIYMKDNYGNEADYNFWNKYIIKGTYTGLTYTYATAALTSNITMSISIHNNYNLLLDQTYTKLNIAYNNKIYESDSILISNNNSKISNNDIKNSLNIIIYNGSECQIKNCHDFHIFGLNQYVSNNNIKGSSNLILTNTYNSNIDNLLLTLSMRYNYTPTFIHIKIISYINDSIVNILDSQLNDIIIDNCNNINILYHNMGQINMSNAENVTLYTDTYKQYMATGTLLQMPQSNAIYFDGIVWAASFK